jgi:hypothetical protein
MKQLNELNDVIASVLAKLHQTAAEDESTEDLVSTLQELVSKRQFLLDVLLADEAMTDRAYLEQQLQCTRQFGLAASELMAHRQSLLQLQSKSKRQINVYETIDANR